MELNISPAMFFSRFILFCWIITVNIPVIAQLNLSVSSQANQYCNGCSYSGGSILINEVMISPLSGDGSMYGLDDTRRGEWIELYNPDSCCPRDISCYYLGNNATDGSPPMDFAGGFELPPGTIVPPAGFVIVRGLNAPAVPSNLLVQNGGKTIEYVVGVNQQWCMGGGERLWFPNAGGWFAFYDANGVPQDAIYWADSLNFADSTNPCNPPGGCFLNIDLPSFKQIPQEKKFYIAESLPVAGYTFKRKPDGGPWSYDINWSPTYGDCNVTPCPQVNGCDGSVTATVSGGTPPYTFTWNDCRKQNTPSASGLCQGTYCVTVTDAVGLQDTACVTVVTMAPVVNINPIAPVCLSADSVQLTQGVPAGGHFNGTGINNDYFFPLMAGVGQHKVHYVVDFGVGCYGEDSTDILVWPSPVPTAIASPDSVCQGQNVHIMATAVNGSGSGYVFQWMGPGNLISNFNDLLIKEINVNQGGSYYLMVTDSRNCTSLFPDSLNLTVFSQPDIDLMLEDTIFLCSGDIYQIRLMEDDTIHYVWQDGKTGYYYSVNHTGTYFVRADFNFCSVSDTIHFLPCTDFWVPNAFTPNLDNINDVFLPKISQDLKEYQLLIYNRWGQLLFTSDNIEKGWDGIYKHEDCKSDVYVYKVSYTLKEGDKHQRQGIVVLVR